MLRRHSRISGALAAAALALGTATVAGTTAPAQAIDLGTDSPLMLWSQPKVTAYSYEGWVYSDLGVKLIAPQEDFEVRADRPADYSGPITAEWTSGASEPTALPMTLNDFSGLPDFLRIKIVRVSDGQTVRNTLLGSCFNGYYSQRVSPDANPRSPYPTMCPWNMYTLGSVMGIEGGHAVSAMGEWGSNFKLKPGKYDVTSSITSAYADAFGVAAEDRATTSRLTVLEEEYEEGRRTPRSVQPRAAASEPDGPAPALAPGNPLPDLKSLPAWNIGMNRKGTAIVFAATVWNAGDSPLVVDGFRRDGEETMDAYQYFFDADGNQVSYTEEPIGEMNWHAENHNHWHFEDFARYRLLNADQSEAVKSTKQSFCLANTDAVDFTLEGADWRPENTDLSTACDGREALSLRQVLSAGSGDTYMQYRYGQAFPIKNVPNGQYWVSVEANPLGNIVESDDSVESNSSLRKIWIKGRADNRHVVVEQVGVIEEFLGGFFRTR